MKDAPYVGLITMAELIEVTNLNQDVARKIAEFERKTWAADLEDQSLILWGEFLRRLQELIREDAFTGAKVIDLFDTLATMDTVALLNRVGSISRKKQKFFLKLLNEAAANPAGDSYSEKAAAIVKRILTAYRMCVIPRAYSKSRLDNIFNELKK
jgi:hypothetical protein